MSHIIYMLVCPQTGKAYVGQTQNLDQRLANHGSNRFASERWPHGFVSQVLAECATRAQASATELAFIAHYNTLKPHGWNDRMSGHAPHEFSDATREKMRMAKIGRWPKGQHPLIGKTKTREHVEKIAAKLRGRTAWNKGVPRTAEHSAKCGGFQKGLVPHNAGRQWSQEVRDKIGAANKQRQAERRALGLKNKPRVLTEEGAAKRKAAFAHLKGKPVPHLAGMGKLNKGVPKSEKHKQAMRDMWADKKAAGVKRQRKPHSAETKARIAAAARLRHAKKATAIDPCASPHSANAPDAPQPLA